MSFHSRFSLAAIASQELILSSILYHPVKAAALMRVVVSYHSYTRPSQLQYIFLQKTYRSLSPIFSGASLLILF
jgi:hypothetical protein